MEESSGIADEKRNTYTIDVVQGAISMEFTFVELSLVDNSIGEFELADTLGPIVLCRRCKVTARPLGHFSSLFFCL